MIVKMKDGSKLETVSGGTWDSTHEGALVVTKGGNSLDSNTIVAIIPWHNLAATYNPDLITYTPRSHRRVKK